MSRLRKSLFGLIGGLFVMVGLFVLSLVFADEFYEVAPGIADPYFCYLQERMIDGDEGHLPDHAKTVQAVYETTPETTACDSADDPAIWVNKADPKKSLIIGANKRSGLSVFNLQGERLSEALTGNSNNVDIREIVTEDGPQIIVAAIAPKKALIELFTLDTDNAKLVSNLGGPIPTAEEFKSEGFCLWAPAGTSDIHAFVIDGSGAVQQYVLSRNADAAYTGKLARTMRVSGQSEGCVADDQTGHLYVAEEDIGIWRFQADANAPTEGTLIAKTGVGKDPEGTLNSDVEGLAIYAPDANDPEAGYLIASSQGNNTYLVYDRAPPHAWRGTFQIKHENHITANTDGLEVVSASLGPDFPQGMLAVQDGWMRKPGRPKQNQNYKFVSWAEISKTLNLE